MKIEPSWSWHEKMVKPPNRHNKFNIFLLPIAVTIAIIFAPIAPSPFGFWLALFAILLGPGWGIVNTLFSSSDLTLPEMLFIVILVSMLVDTIIFSSLNSFGILLSQFLINITVLTITFATTIMAYIYKNRKEPTPIIVNDSKVSWFLFTLGILLAVTLAMIIIKM